MMVQRYGRLGGEILINTRTEKDQFGPNMAATAAGGFIAVWTDLSGLGGDASGAAIKGQRFDSAGQKIGTEFLVNSTTFEFQSDARIAVLSSGRFAVTWTDTRVVANDLLIDVRARLFNADGTPAGNDFLVNTTTSGFQNLSAVAALSGGGFVVAWTDGSQSGVDASSLSIRGQLFNSSGAKVGGEFVMNTTTAAAQGTPSVAALASGGFVVSWTDSSQTGRDTSQSAVRMQLFNAAGAKVGTEKLVNTVIDQAQSGAHVLGLKGGGFLVLWTDGSKLQDASGTAVKGQLFSATGAKVGSEFLVNTETEGDQGRPRASSLPNGGFTVTWESSAPSGTGVDIKAQLFDSVGKKVGAEFLIPSEAVGNETIQSVVTLASGEVVIAWTDASASSGDTSGASIRAQIIGVASLAPGDIAISNVFISETAVENQTVATLSTAGALNSSYSYTLVSDSTGGAFRIEDGKLIVQDNSLLNYEAAKTAEIRVRTTDDDGKSFEETIKLTITDTPEQGYKAGAEFLVNTSTLGDQSGAKVATLANGSVVALWRQDTSTSPYVSSSVGKVKILNSDGNALSGELAIEGSTVAALPSGGFATIDERGAYEDSRLVLHRFSASGAPIGQELEIFSSRGEPHFASAAASSAGTILIAWHDVLRETWDNSIEIRGQLVSAAGVPIGTDFRINTSAYSPGLPEVTALASGAFVVAWNDGGTIRGQMFTAHGQPLGNEIRASSGDDPVFDAQVTALASGGFVITSTVNQSSGGYAGVGSFTAQIFDAVGEKVGGLVQIGDPSHVYATDIMALSWGGFVASWSAHDDVATNDSGVRAQVFDATGHRVGAELRVNNALAGAQLFPSLAALESGAFMVSWYDASGTGGDSSGSSAKAKIFTPAVPGATLEGTTGDDRLAGTSVADRLSGLAGNDTLDGRAGADTMTGGTGNDVYVVGNAGDKVVEAAAGGTDTVRSAISYTLGDNLEILVLTGAASISGIGNGLDNALTGNVAANVLNGGAGADTMTGGAGNDTYSVDDARDKVVETSAAGGTDTVRSSVSYTLGNHVERLVLTGTAATKGTGNNLGNAITGNAGANALDGGGGNDVLDGGAGADAMTGGSGADLFIVDNAGDKAIESSATGGTDSVRSAVTFTLGANVENLLLTGSAAANGTGNALANVLSGNAAANILNGAAGADTMAGGAGNDVYFVDNAGDQVVETSPAGGSDTVRSAIGFALGANVEHLLLTGGAANGTGNGLANRITGNGAANILKGGSGADTLDGGAGDDKLFGGTGTDSLRGGGGYDQFTFDRPLGSSNVDAIRDFYAPSDSIFLSRGIFTAAGPNGRLSTAAFCAGKAAADSSDRIVYDQATGNIFYDADGSGAAAKVLFATVAPGTTLGYSDFVIYG